MFIVYIVGCYELCASCTCKYCVPSPGCLISVGDRDFQLGCSYYSRSTISSRSRPPKAPLGSHVTNEIQAQPTNGPLANKRLTNSMNNIEVGQATQYIEFNTNILYKCSEPRNRNRKTVGDAR